MLNSLFLSYTWGSETQTPAVDIMLVLISSKPLRSWLPSQHHPPENRPRVSKVYWTFEMITSKETGRVYLQGGQGSKHSCKLSIKCQTYIMRHYDIQANCSESSRKKQMATYSTHPGSSLQVLTHTYDSPVRLTKMQLIVLYLDIRVLSFLQGKTLVTEVTISQGQEGRAAWSPLKTLDT